MEKQAFDRIVAIGLLAKMHKQAADDAPKKESLSDILRKYYQKAVGKVDEWGKEIGELPVALQNYYDQGKDALAGIGDRLGEIPDEVLAWMQANPEAAGAIAGTLAGGGVGALADGWEGAGIGAGVGAGLGAGAGYGYRQWKNHQASQLADLLDKKLKPRTSPVKEQLLKELAPTVGPVI